MFHESEYYDEPFKEMKFTGEELDSVRFYDCTFTDCDFSETVFRDCKFSGCSFTNCDLNMIGIIDCDFSRVSFSHCKLVGINWTEAYWPKIAVPSLLKFEDCTLNYSTFIGLSLPRSVFKQCLIKDADFREADLTKADMSSSDFSESLFGGTNLTGADFSHAVNYRIDPSGNQITKATFMLPEAVSLLYCMDIHIKDDE